VYSNSNGGFDFAQLFDSAGNDTLVGRRNVSTISGSSYFIQASNFDALTARSTRGGVDTATLYASAVTNVFGGTPARSFLNAYDSRGGLELYQVLLAFENVLVVGGRGKDRANLTGSTGADSFFADYAGSAGVNARLTNSRYSLQVRGFDQVFANGGGGSDSAQFTDSSVNDHVYVEGALVQFRYNGGSAYVESKGFRNVAIHGTTGVNQRRVIDGTIDYVLQFYGPWIAL